MKDADLVRWAAELCGWEVDDGLYPRTDGCWIGRPGTQASKQWHTSNYLRPLPQHDLKALMADLLARFIEATPKPKAWARSVQLEVLEAITESPIACIRAIHESGVLNNDT